MQQAPVCITADELLAMPDDGYRHELVEGRLITMPPPQPVHGLHVGRIYRALADHVERLGLGVTLTETGFKLQSDPDTVRAPDVSFIAAPRLPEELPDTYWEGAPDLAVEVVSPSNRAGEVARKVREYLACGARAVWVVHPKTRTLTRHRPGGTTQRVQEGETLVEPDVLPGFEYAVTSLFGPLRR